MSSLFESRNCQFFQCQGQCDLSLWTWSQVPKLKDARASDLERKIESHIKWILVDYFWFSMR